MNFKKGVYDFLRNLAQIYLPAAGTLYFGLSGIWNLPYADQVVGTVVAVDTFLGVVLKLSSIGYKPPLDGRLEVDTSDPLKNVYRLALDTHPQDIIDKNQKLVTMAVVQAQAPVEVHDE